MGIYKRGGGGRSWHAAEGSEKEHETTLNTEK